jgi:hypothetical protein
MATLDQYNEDQIAEFKEAFSLFDKDGDGKNPWQTPVQRTDTTLSPLAQSPGSLSVTMQYGSLACLLPKK